MQSPNASAAEHHGLAFRSAVSQVPSIRARPVRRPGLEAALHRGLDPALGLGVRTASPNRSESRRKSSVGASAIALTRSLTVTGAGGRKSGDPMRERPDEVVERVGGQRAIDPAVPLGQFRVVVLRAQHDLERPGAAHETGEVLGAAAAGTDRNRLRTGRRSPTRARRSACRTPARTRCHAAYAAFDLRDCDQRLALR